MLMQMQMQIIVSVSSFGCPALHGKDALSMVSLQLETDLAHSLGALARLDLIGLLAFSSSLGASFLVELLLSSLTLLLEALEDINGAALRNVSS